MTKPIFYPKPLPVFSLWPGLHGAVSERVGWKLDQEWFRSWGDIAEFAYWGLVSDLDGLE